MKNLIKVFAVIILGLVGNQLSGLDFGSIGKFGTDIANQIKKSKLTELQKQKNELTQKKVDIETKIEDLKGKGGADVVVDILLITLEPVKTALSEIEDKIEELEPTAQGLAKLKKERDALKSQQNELRIKALNQKLMI